MNWWYLGLEVNNGDNFWTNLLIERTTKLVKFLTDARVKKNYAMYPVVTGHLWIDIWKPSNNSREKHHSGRQFFLETLFTNFPRR
jgi:hypothetical protein